MYHALLTPHYPSAPPQPVEGVEAAAPQDGRVRLGTLPPEYAPRVAEPDRESVVGIVQIGIAAVFGAEWDLTTSGGHHIGTRSRSADGTVRRSACLGVGVACFRTRRGRSVDRSQIMGPEAEFEFLLVPIPAILFPPFSGNRPSEVPENPMSPPGLELGAYCLGVEPTGTRIKARNHLSLTGTARSAVLAFGACLGRSG